MKFEELRGKSEDELKSLLADHKKEALNLRFQQATGELENTSRIREVRRTVARIVTLLANPKLNTPPEGGVKKKKATAKKPADKAAKKPAKKKAA